MDHPILAVYLVGVAVAAWVRGFFDIKLDTMPLAAFAALWPLVLFIYVVELALSVPDKLGSRMRGRR